MARKNNRWHGLSSNMAMMFFTWEAALWHVTQLTAKEISEA